MLTGLRDFRAQIVLKIIKVVVENAVTRVNERCSLGHELLAHKRMLIPGLQGTPGIVGTNHISSLFTSPSQGSYGGYVYTYAVKSPLRMTSAQGAFLTSVFWVSMGTGCLSYFCVCFRTFFFRKVGKSIVL